MSVQVGVEFASDDLDNAIASMSGLGSVVSADDWPTLVR